SGATTAATVTVTAAPVTLTWTPATPVVYGTPLAMSATVTPAVPGAVHYFEGTTEILAATQLSAGVHSLTAVFTPTDANYSGATTAATVTVTAAPVTLTWTPATPVVYGTPLALTATVTPAVPGAVHYFEGATEVKTGRAPCREGGGVTAVA